MTAILKSKTLPPEGERFHDQEKYYLLTDLPTATKKEKDEQLRAIELYKDELPYHKTRTIQIVLAEGFIQPDPHTGETKRIRFNFPQKFIQNALMGRQFSPWVTRALEFYVNERYRYLPDPHGELFAEPQQKIKKKTFRQRDPETDLIKQGVQLTKK